MTVLNIFFGEHRRVLFALITAALKEKVAGSALGKLWIVLFPITFLTIYGTVFYVILGIRVPELGGEQSLLLILCGIVPFFAFAESLNVGTLSLISNRETISSSIIPFELLVLRDVIVANVNLIVGMLIIVVSAAFVGNLTWAALWIPCLVVFQVLFTLGIVWILSVVVLFVRDLTQMMPMIIIVLMLVSPIAYTEKMIPENLTIIITINPLAWFILAYRDLILVGEASALDLAYIAFISLASFIAGLKFAKRMKFAVFDNV